MAITISAQRPIPPGTTNPLVSGIPGTRTLPQRLPDPNSVSPVDRISSNPNSRSGASGLTQVVVGQPIDQSGAAARTASFTSANSTTAAGSSQLSAFQQQQNLDAVAARKSGVLGCIGKSPGTTPGCNNPCDTVDCLTKLLTGNLLDLDAKKLMCDTIASTERTLKRQIDSTGDQLLSAAETLTSLAPVIAPLNTLQRFVNKIDAGAVADCFGAQALKDKVNGKFNKAKNTIRKFQKGYQDKIAEKFNTATAAAQQFSVTPNLCASSTPASLGSLIG